MPDVYKKSITLTILIVVPMTVTNKLLLYLHDIKPEKELLILSFVGIVLVAIIFLIATHIRETIKPSDVARFQTK